MADQAQTTTSHDLGGRMDLMKRNLQDALDDSERFPHDVPHWIVEMHTEYDQRNMTPLEAVKKAANEIKDGHCWIVTHVRSGLKWSVNLGKEEVVEVVEAHFIETRNLKS
jgi:hypothetical protein